MVHCLASWQTEGLKFCVISSSVLTIFSQFADLFLEFYFGGNLHSVMISIYSQMNCQFCWNRVDYKSA
jgi:hypothetical protein